MLKINGTDSDSAGKTVEQYIAETNYNLSRIAVEINGEILPKFLYGSTVLHDGDTVEIVGFVGGG